VKESDFWPRSFPGCQLSNDDNSAPGRRIALWHFSFSVTIAPCPRASLVDVPRCIKTGKSGKGGENVLALRWRRIIRMNIDRGLFDRPPIDIHLGLVAVHVPCARFVETHSSISDVL
jgi:hypothetical protein